MVQMRDDSPIFKNTNPKKPKKPTPNTNQETNPRSISPAPPAGRQWFPSQSSAASAQFTRPPTPKSPAEFQVEVIFTEDMED
uniref:Uncharacterized protein n=1 Tax=Romanomermis culicivorax TaxID=13658 RepID=A0A915J0T6_ROMCU